MQRTLALVLTVFSTVAVAQETPPEGCFCLSDKQVLPQIQRGCRREKFPNQFFWRAICRYVDASGNQVVAPAITIDETWTILPADHPDCEKCDPQIRSTKTVPRNENGEEDETEKHKNSEDGADQ